MTSRISPSAPWGGSGLGIFWVGLYGCSAFGNGTDGRDFLGEKKMSSRISCAPCGGVGLGGDSGLVDAIFHLLKKRVLRRSPGFVYTLSILSEQWMSRSTMQKSLSMLVASCRMGRTLLTYSGAQQPSSPDCAPRSQGDVAMRLDRPRLETKKAEQANGTGV
jgi:hypothetical protein